MQQSAAEKAQFCRLYNDKEACAFSNDTLARKYDYWQPPLETVFGQNLRETYGIINQ